MPAVTNYSYLDKANNNAEKSNTLEESRIRKTHFSAVNVITVDYSSIKAM